MISDDTDLKLVGLLQKDGLQSMAELSKAIGVAPSTLNDRVKSTGRLGVITGTHMRMSIRARPFSTRWRSFSWVDGTQRSRRNSGAGGCCAEVL